MIRNWPVGKEASVNTSFSGGKNFTLHLITVLARSSNENLWSWKCKCSDGGGGECGGVKGGEGERQSESESEGHCYTSPSQPQAGLLLLHWL